MRGLQVLVCGVALTLPLCTLTACAGGGGGASPIAGAPPAPAAQPAPNPIANTYIDPNWTGPTAVVWGKRATGQTATTWYEEFNADAELRVGQSQYTLITGPMSELVMNAQSLGADQRFWLYDGPNQTYAFQVRRGARDFSGGAGGMTMAFYDDSRGAFSAETGVVSYQTFGYWSWSNTSAGLTDTEYGGFSTGQGTAAAAIPTLGQASFRGHLLGDYQAGAGAPVREIHAGVTVTANFAGRSAAFSSGDWLSDAGALSGTALSGQLTWTAGQNSLSGPLTTANGALTGPASARFYGPKAEEIGGVFRLAPPNGGDTRVVGAFGAANN